MIGRTNTGGGGTGATLTVTAPAGCTVTVSKDGKTKTKTAGTDGVAVFKGLATGEWTVTITDGEQTAQKTVTITADYSAAITFFSATIHVTYPTGSICTATYGVTTLTAPDTSGTWDCVVPNAAVWTVSLDSGFAETVNVTTSGVTYTVDKWHLYNRGDQCAAVTGGWSCDGYTHSTYDISPGRIDSDKIVLAGSTRGIGTMNAINLAGTSKLTVTGKIVTAATESFTLMVAKQKGSYNQNVIASLNISNAGTFSQDVALDGNVDSAYVFMYTQGYSNINVEIYSVSVS